MDIIFVNKKSVKYILSGNPIRIKNLVKNKLIKNYEKGENVSIFYKNKFNFFSNGKVLAVGEFFEDFIFKGNENGEKEILKLKKVF
jgi:hypothetical protein